VAKIEEFKSRASALADDNLQDDFYRPAAPSKLRPKQLSELPSGPLPRYQPEDTPEEDVFLRARRRVPVRKGFIPRSRAGRLALGAGIVAGLAVVAVAAIAARSLLKHDPRFRIDNSDSIQILGNSEVTRPELLSVFGSDIGRNVFFVPLAERRAALEDLPWVEHATVMRLLPNQLRVAIVERTPVAFVRNGSEIGLVDGSGVLLDMAPATMAAKHYSFPVVTGIDPADPLSTRTARMHIYRNFLDALDAGGEKISSQLSEVDLSDPEDVKAVVPVDGADMLLHFGDTDFLARFHNYQAHLAEWRQQYPHLASRGQRDDRAVVLVIGKGSTPDPQTTPSEQSQRDQSQTGSAPAIGEAAVQKTVPSRHAAFAAVHKPLKKPVTNKPAPKKLIARKPASTKAAAPAYHEAYDATPAPQPATSKPVAPPISHTAPPKLPPTPPMGAEAAL
jgi:cell division protein FtsQ